MKVWTIGHSTRSLAELTALLVERHGIASLADVRSVPYSQRHPQFNREILEAELPDAGVAYHWLGESLGGYRRSGREDSLHIGLGSGGFRAFAEHMETAEFGRGIARLLMLAAGHRTAYMCAEKPWWQCHRRFVSDYLVAVEGAEVIHIFDDRQTETHRVHPCARIEGRRLVYDLEETGSLFG